MTEAYRKLGDLGAVAAQVLPRRDANPLSVLDVQAAFGEIAAARGPVAKAARIRDLLSHATPLLKRDKLPEEADSIERVEEIYRKQAKQHPKRKPAR